MGYEQESELTADRRYGVGVLPLLRDYAQEAYDAQQIALYSGGDPQDWSAYDDNPRLCEVVRSNYLNQKKNAKLTPVEILFGNREVEELPLGADPNAAVIKLIGPVSGPTSLEFGGLLVADVPEDSGRERPHNYRYLSEVELTNLHRYYLAVLDVMKRAHEGNPHMSDVIGLNFGNDLRAAVPLYDRASGNFFVVNAPNANPTQRLWVVHAHPTIFDDRTVELQNFDSLPGKDRQKVIEPYLKQSVDVFNQLILNPVLAETPELSEHITIHTETESDQVFPKGIILEFSKDFLGDPRLARALQTMHQKSEELYETFFATVVDIHAYRDGILIPLGEETRNQNITRLLSDPRFAELEPRTRTKVRQLLQSVPRHIEQMLARDTMRQAVIAEKPELKDQFFFVDPHLAIQCMQLGNVFGPNYHLVYREHPGDPQKMQLIIGPRWVNGDPWSTTLGYLKKSRPVTTEEDRAVFTEYANRSRRLLKEVAVSAKTSLQQ